MTRATCSAVYWCARPHCVACSRRRLRVRCQRHRQRAAPGMLPKAPLPPSSGARAQVMSVFFSVLAGAPFNPLLLADMDRSLATTQARSSLLGNSLQHACWRPGAGPPRAACSLGMHTPRVALGLLPRQSAPPWSLRPLPFHPTSAQAHFRELLVDIAVCGRAKSYGVHPQLAAPAVVRGCPPGTAAVCARCVCTAGNACPSRNGSLPKAPKPPGPEPRTYCRCGTWAPGPCWL